MEWIQMFCILEIGMCFGAGIMMVINTMDNDDRRKNQDEKKGIK
jgi:hypothetical protein